MINKHIYIYNSACVCLCLCVPTPSCPSCPVSLSGCPPGTRRQLSFQSAALIASPKIMISKATVCPTPDPTTELTQSKRLLLAAATTPLPSAAHHSTQTPSFSPSRASEAAPPCFISWDRATLFSVCLFLNTPLAFW